MVLRTGTRGAAQGSRPYTNAPNPRTCEGQTRGKGPGSRGPPTECRPGHPADSSMGHPAPGALNSPSPVATHPTGLFALPRGRRCLSPGQSRFVYALAAAGTRWVAERSASRRAQHERGSASEAFSLPRTNGKTHQGGTPAKRVRSLRHGTVARIGTRLSLHSEPKWGRERDAASCRQRKEGTASTA